MRKTSKIIVATIVLAMLLLGVGYAAYQNITLTISGTAKADPSQSNFDVGFTGNVDIVKSQGIDVKTNVQEGSTTASINVSGFTSIGQTATVTYRVKNSSTDIPSVLSVTTTKGSLFVTNCSLGKTRLEVGETTTVKVSVKLEKMPDGNESAEENILVSLKAEPVIPGNEGTGNTGTTKYSLASQIDASNYGDYVNYNKNLGLTLNLEGENTIPKTDWRIFYEDIEQDRVYLIASDYVPNTSNLLETSLPMTVYGNYSLYLPSTPDKISKISRQDSIFGINASSYRLNENYNNSKKASILLDTYYWSNFVNTTVADYAIGGPTIEMYANSWNEKGYEEMIPWSYRTIKGYMIDGSTNLNISSSNGYKDNLYYPHRTTIGIGSENCMGYWLASPSNRSEDSVITILCDSSICGSEYYFYNISVRPVVSLKPGITATRDTNGIWQLGE